MHPPRAALAVLTLALTLPLAAGQGADEGPLAFFTLTPPTTRTATEVVADASASRASEGADITEYAWRWSADAAFEPGERRQTHAYNQGGVHVVTLRITDSSGNVAFANQTVLVRGETPTANFFIAEKEETALGLRVVVNASFSYAPGDATIVRHEWDFEGTGEFRAGNVTEEHVYTTPGAHVIRLRVTDSLERTDVVTEPVVVESTFLGRLFTLWEERALFARAALMTLYLAVIATILGFLLAVAVALLRISRLRLLRWPAAAYIEILRGTPLLVQVLIAWLVLPQVGLKLGVIQAGLLALVVNTSAYQAEAIRAGIQAIPTGQMEAAVSLGMTYPQAMRHVILPQAFRLVIPPLGNEFIILLKDTSIISVIGVVELTQAAQIFAARTFLVLEAFVGVAMMYFVLTYSLSLGLRRLERRLAIPGLGLGGGAS